MPIPPVTLNLLQLLPGDDQNVHTDKINYNFDQILALGGGPPGIPGIQGIQGVPGSQGIQGFQGDPGTPGSYWYVQNTLPPLSPAPNVGDYWFNTDTLDVSSWNGTSWDLIGNLTIAGVFKEATGDPDRVIFTNPSPAKSLVISPIDYGVGAPPGGAYKMKLIGTSGTNLLNFGVVETGSVENSSSLQSYITVSTIVPNTEYSLGMVNPAGNIEINSPGTSLVLKQQASGISNYEFNGASLKVQLNANERNLGFSPVAGSGVGFHIGLQDALITPASRGLSLIDQAGFGGFFPKLSLRGASSDPVTNDVTNFGGGIFMDAKHPQLSGTAASSDQLWWRYRTNVGGGKKATLSLATRRTFNDPGNGTNPGRSTAMELIAGLDGTNWHKIGFTGGAVDATAGTRPQIRITPPVAGKLIAVDQNGNMGFGSTAFIQDNNSDTLPGQQFATNIVVEGPASGTSIGSNIFSGIHFVPETATGTSTRRMGMTAGLNDPFGAGVTAVQGTHAGVLFKRTGTAMGIELSTSTAGISIGGGTLGAKTRMSIEGNGLIHMHGRLNHDQVATRDYKLTYALDGGASVTGEGVGLIYAYDSLADASVGMYKDIVLQPYTDTKSDSIATTFHGGGFLGIGDMTSFTHDKPQTKLHMKGAATFGSRAAISDYATEVGTDDNWTFGALHSTNAAGGMIIGGLNQSMLDPVSYSVLIGSTPTGGLVLDQADQNNMVVIGTNTFATTETVGTTMPDPAKGGIFEGSYAQGTSGASAYVFGTNSPGGTTDALMRLHYFSARNDAGNKASNGLDIVANRTVGGKAIKIGGGGPAFVPPTATGYYIHCIDQTYDSGFGSFSEDTAFIVDGRNKVAIGRAPMYRPNDSGFLVDDPSTWPLATDVEWLDYDDFTLQVNGTYGTEGSGISIMNGETSSSAVAGDRQRRNNPYDSNLIAYNAWIATPNRIIGSTTWCSVGVLHVTPGLQYSTSSSASARIHGATVYVKGGDVGSSNLSAGVLRGGDVVIHGGKAWENNDKTTYRATTLNNNPATDTGYGNVSLAYDWENEQSAGSVSVGVGTPVCAMYVCHAEVKRNGAPPASVSGKDFRGQPVTYTHVSYVANQSLYFRFNFPTPLPTSNIYAVVTADNNNGSGNDYRFQVLSTAKTTTSITILAVQADVRWEDGVSANWDNDNPVGITAVVYCLPD